MIKNAKTVLSIYLGKDKIEGVGISVSWRIVIADSYSVGKNCELKEMVLAFSRILSSKERK